jgi:hypothetical protein
VAASQEVGLDDDATFAPVREAKDQRKLVYVAVSFFPLFYIFAYGTNALVVLRHKADYQVVVRSKHLLHLYDFTVRKKPRNNFLEHLLVPHREDQYSAIPESELVEIDVDSELLDDALRDQLLYGA